MKSNRLIVTTLAFATFLLSSCKDKIVAPSRFEVAAPTTIRDAVRLTGTVEPLDSVDIKSEVSGRLVKVPVHEGDAVRRGQLVAQIDTVPFLLTRDKAVLQVDRAKLAMASAKRDLDRARALVSTGSVSLDHVEDLDVALQRSQLDLRDANLTLRNCELDLARTHLKAPMDGRLIAFTAEVGEVVASAVGLSGGTTLGTVADPTKLKVVVEVGELDYGRLKLGMSVLISTEGGKPRPGHVSFIPSSARPSADTKTIKVFPVEVILEGDTEGLLPGMTVGVDFVFLQREVAVAIAYEAVKMGGKGAAGGSWGKDKSAGAGATTSVAGSSPMDSGAKKVQNPSDSTANGPRKHGEFGGKKGPGEWGGKGHRDGGDSGPGSKGEGWKGKKDSNPSSGPGAWGGGRMATVLVRGDKGVFVPKPVKIGVTDFRKTEILDGLAVGDTVWIQDDASGGKQMGQGAMGPPGGGKGGGGR